MTWSRQRSIAPLPKRTTFCNTRDQIQKFTHKMEISLQSPEKPTHTEDMHTWSCLLHKKKKKTAGPQLE